MWPNCEQEKDKDNGGIQMEIMKTKRRLWLWSKRKCGVYSVQRIGYNGTNRSAVCVRVCVRFVCWYTYKATV